jgi:hypothetical protein
MKILIVGTGPVSQFFYETILKRNIKGLEIYISENLNEKEYKQSLFGPNTLYYRSGFRGLGKLWHGVMDVDLVKSLGPIENTSYFNNFNKIQNEAFEFIPFFVPRFKHVKNLLTQVQSIELIDQDGVVIKHKCGEKNRYDFVFFGTGFGDKNDPIVNSGLAKRPDFVSDHLIFNSNVLEKGTTEKIFSLNGHYRQYSIEQVSDFSIKRSFRPALSSSIADSKNKAIYSTGKYEILKNLISSGLMPQLISSLSLRYGTPSLALKGYNFFQLKMKNIYQYNFNGKLELNKDIFYSNNFTQLLSYLKVSRNSILSGIHLHDGYRNIEKNQLISWNNENIKSARLIILTPNTKCTIDERHFTSYFMRLGEIAANKIPL